MHGIHWGRGWRIYGLPVLQRHSGSTITIGRNLDLRSSLRSNPLAPDHPVVLSTRRPASSIAIGDSFAMTGGVLCADLSIHIGNRVSVGANCLIVDTDFHPLLAAHRRVSPNQGDSEPVVIEDDVFLGAHAIVLKGVRIGARSVIGAGAVVTRSVPPDSLVAGNPARVLRSLSLPLQPAHQ